VSKSLVLIEMGWGLSTVLLRMRIMLTWILLNTWRAIRGDGRKMLDLYFKKPTLLKLAG
jgi:hypothetical protein